MMIFQFQMYFLLGDGVAEELSLPPVKIHCSVLAEGAIKRAIQDFQDKRIE